MLWDASESLENCIYDLFFFIRTCLFFFIKTGLFFFVKTSPFVFFIKTGLFFFVKACLFFFIKAYLFFFIKTSLFVFLISFSLSKLAYFFFIKTCLFFFIKTSPFVFLPSYSILSNWRIFRSVKTLDFSIAHFLHLSAFISNSLDASQRKRLEARSKTNLAVKWLVWCWFSFFVPFNCFSDRIHTHINLDRKRIFCLIFFNSY